MSHFRLTLRRLLVPAAGILLFATALLVAPAPAQAVNYSGSLYLKGGGNSYRFAYTSGNPTVARAGASGQTLSYGIKVGNYGVDEAQYVLNVQQSGLNAEVGLYDGSKLLRLAKTPDGYVTPPMASLDEVFYTLKVKAFDANVSWRHTSVDVTLKARDGTVLQTGTARFEIKAPTKGSSTADMTAKQGSQAYVGSRWETQYTESPYVASPKTAKFTVKAAVNAGAPHRVRIYIPLVDPLCHSFTVTDGTTDVTAAVQAGTYYTKVLSQGQSSLLTVTNAKTLRACLYQYLSVQGGAEGEAFTTTVVLIA